MKIAYIAPTGIFGGVRIVNEHLNRLTARGHDCTLLYLNGQPLTWLPARYEQRPVNDAGAGYNVIVGTAIGTWGMAADLARAQNAKSAGLMQMAEWLFDANPESQAQQLQAFTTPLDVVMPISEWLAKLCEAVEGRNVARIRNGIDTSLFYSDPFTDLPPFDGATVIIEGYSNNRAKDTDGMAFAAVRRLKLVDGVPLRVMGFSQFPAQFEFDYFWQTPPQHAIRKIYSSADVFLKASRYEGRPGPDMEAMACGAVVCRAIGTGDDDLHHEQNCLKTEYGNLDQFTDNLRRILFDHELRARLRANALEYVKTQYDWDGAIDLVEQALTGGVTRPDSAAPQKAYQYDLAEYNQLQADIVSWETPQAVFLGETLADMLEPKSVIDIGCGPGIYLVPFKPEARVLGVDGAPAAGKSLEPHEFIHADLREDWHIDQHFDLSLCIETGEHLPPDRADYLIDLLTTCSNACFFSAAQPGQGGTLHLNEQPREWWIEKFRAHGWELHPRNDELQDKILRNEHCRRVQWLIGNSFLIERKVQE